MTKKKCSGCKKKKPKAEFTKNTHQRDGLNHMCRECQRGYNRQHYANNKNYYKAKARTANIRHQEMLQVIMRHAKSKPCLDCQQPYPHYAMDFDHVRGKKSFTIGLAARRGNWLPKEKLLREIKKCDPVCSNCHRIRTWKRGHQDE